MPQHNRNSLIHILLLWTIFLSIIQAVFIVLFFTDQSQRNSAVASERFQANCTPLSPNVSGTMLTFQAIQGGQNITWLAKTPDNSTVSVDKELEENLNIKKDGYYYLNLQVTLSPCEKTQRPEYTVSLMRDDSILLQGRIKTNSCSTGLLGKVQKLHAGGTLVVIINPPTTDVSSNEFLSHLDIIYMPDP